MIRLRLRLLLLLLMLLPTMALARQSAQGDCVLGGKVVVTNGLNSTTKVMASYPSCTVTVSIHGGGLATIYSDNVGTVLSNPFTATTAGHWQWFADSGHYDVLISGGSPQAMPSSFTYSDIILNDTSQLTTTVCGLSFNASTVFTAASCSDFTLTLTGNVTASTISNAVTGQQLNISLCQDATGGRTFAWPPNFIRPPTISPASSSCTNVMAFFDGLNWRQMGATGDTLTPTAGGITGTWLGSPIWSGAHTHNGNDIHNGNETFVGTNTISNLNGWIYLDGVKYTTLALALAAVPSGGTVRISAGTYTITSTVSPASNVDIECDPNNLTVLQASAVLNPTNGMIFFNNVNHFKLSGCVIDGNRANNTNQFELIRMVGSTHGEISNNHILNSQTSGILLVSGNSLITIKGNEIERNGQPLPTSSGAGIGSVPNAAVSNSSITFIENKVHDNNIGLVVFPSSLSINLTQDWDISHNSFYLNANDGLQVFSANAALNGLIRGFRVIDNESWCNGWPANGTNRSVNCPAAGFLQSGAVASPSGSGFDFNSPVMEQFTVAVNRARDNFFEGFDITPQLAGFVSCTNAANSICTIQSGDLFNTAWKTGQGIRINGANFTISSTTSTSSLVLNQNTGTLTNVPYVGTGYARMTVTGNIAYHNGYGQLLSTSGQGFSNIGYGDNFNGNIAYDNFSYGMIDINATFVNHTGDKAFNNCGGGGSCQQGFLCQACLRPQFKDIVTDDSRSANTQFYGVFLDTLTTFAVVGSNAICNFTTCGNSVVNDNGSFDIVDSGRDRGGSVNGGLANLYFNGGGGQGGIDYEGGGGAFLSKIPAISGTLTLNAQNRTIREQLVIADQGTSCTTGELVLSAGWGTTATVTAVSGLGGQTCKWTITSAGTGQAANPTITDTLTNAMPAASLCDMHMVGGTGTLTTIENTTLSATAPVFTFNGTPVAASTYKVIRSCGP